MYSGFCSSGGGGLNGTGVQSKSLSTKSSGGSDSLGVESKMDSTKDAAGSGGAGIQSKMDSTPPNRRLFYYICFLASLSLAIISDQAIKQLILEGFRFDGPFISIILVKNTGVAFSMLAFLGGYLKYLQLALLLVLCIYFLRDRRLLSSIAPFSGLLIGAGLSNILDRFIHGGVIDYIWWHYLFSFAVFNLADILINIAVFMIVIILFVRKG